MTELRDQLARAFCAYWNGGKPSESSYEQWDLIATSYSLAERAMPIIEADWAGYQKGVLDAFDDALDAANARADRAEAEVKLLWKLLREAADEIARTQFQNREQD